MTSEKDKHKGWHGENQRHSDVQKKGALENTLRQPMVKKDFNYFMRKFNLTPKSDSRIHAKGRIQRVYKENEPQKTTIIINDDTELTKYHELGHLIAEDIIQQEFKREGEMVLTNSFRTIQTTVEEFSILNKMINREDSEQISILEGDIKKISESIPPYDKIPKPEKSRILKQYTKQINEIKKRIIYLSKPTEVFANFFAIYQIDRNSAISSLPRLYAIWGDIIENYMRDA